MKKNLVMVLALALIVSLFVGCGNGGADKVELKIMIMAEDSNRQAIYQDFYKDGIAEAFPDYDIQFELPGSGANYNSKLSVYNASETLPDIFWGAESVYLSGSVLPLTDRIKADGFYDKFSNKAGLIPASDGEIYALSPGSDAFFAGPIFYNKDMFDELGLEMATNYDEFLQLVIDLKAAGVIPISIVKFAYEFFLVSDLLSAEDPHAMAKIQSGEVDVDGEEYLEAVRKLDELRKAGAFPEDVVTLEQQPHEELFTSGKAAMIYHPLWVYPAIRDAGFEIDFAYLPEVFGAENTVNAWGSAYNGFMIAKNSAHPDAALEVAEWLVMQDAEYWKTVAGNATCIEGFDTLPADAPEVNTYFFEKMLDPNTVVYPCFGLNFFTTAQQVDHRNELDKLVAGQTTPEDFVSKAAEFRKSN